MTPTSVCLDDGCGSVGPIGRNRIGGGDQIGFTDGSGLVNLRIDVRQFLLFDGCVRPSAIGYQDIETSRTVRVTQDSSRLRIRRRSVNPSELPHRYPSFKSVILRDCDRQSMLLVPFTPSWCSPDSGLPAANAAEGSRDQAPFSCSGYDFVM